MKSSSFVGGLLLFYLRGVGRMKTTTEEWQAHEELNKDKIQALFKRKEEQLGMRVLGYQFDKFKNIQALTYDDLEDTYTTFTSYYIGEDELSYKDFYVGEQYENQAAAIANLEERLGRSLPQDVIDTFEEERQATESYKKAYSQSILQQIMEKAKENKTANSERSLGDETAYKNSYKQSLLSALGVSNDPQPAPQVVAPAETVTQDKDKTSQEIEAFEKKHSFELVYLLKKEVINEVKQLDLTLDQLQVLNDIEKQLDQEKEAYTQQNEVTQNVAKKSMNELEK